MSTTDPIIHRLAPRHVNFAFARLEDLLDDAPRCPMCRAAHWQVNDRLDVYRDDGLVANLHLRCQSCGFIASFDAVLLGLVGPRGGLVSGRKMTAYYAERDVAPLEVFDAVPPRELWWSWVAIDGFDIQRPELCAEYGGGDVGVGYLYLDADAGATVRLVALATDRDGQLVEVGQVPREVMVVLRPGSFSWRSVRPLGAREGEVPLGMEFYRRPALEPLRALVALDEHRAPGYPDDVRVVVLPPGALLDAIPEQVWVRLEGQRPTGELVGFLLNAPRERRLGLVAGQRVAISFDPKRPGFLYFRAPGEGASTAS